MARLGASSKLTGRSPAELTEKSKHPQSQNSVGIGLDVPKLGLSNTGGDSGLCSEEGGEQKHRRQILNRNFDNRPVRPLGSNGKSRNVTSSLHFRGSDAVSSRKTKVAIRHHSVPILEDDDSYVYDTTTLSDFINDDSSLLCEEDSEYDTVAVLPQPRPTRRLVQGIRPDREPSSEVEDRKPEKSESLWNANTIQPITPPRRGNQYPVLDLANYGNKDIVFTNDIGLTEKSDPRSKSKGRAASSDIDEPLAILSFSPSKNESPLKVPKEAYFVTPPTSPQKNRPCLISPKKLPRIPLTPHQPSTGAFWSQDVVNKWNDEFSPRKPHKTQPAVIEDGESINYLLNKSPKNNLTKLDRGALETKKAFEKRKHEIAEAFLAELDKSIAAGRVSDMAASTGGVTIIWSKKLNTTAGRANWRREGLKPVAQTAGGNSDVKYKHYASIELAEKVIDSEERLLNVIAHEFCHLANFMVSGIKNNPHGKEFKSWAAKCSQLFGHRGIQVTTKHSYKIDYKYVWECTDCGTEFQRHSKSIDPTRHQCGSCKGKLAQTKPVPRVSRATNEYQMFVKENMKRIKQENPGSPQKDIMGIVGRRYQEHKASQLAGDGMDAPEIEIGTGGADRSRDTTPLDNMVDAAARKLDFLDLTSL